MKLFRRPPAIGNVPRVTDGTPPSYDLQEQVIENQVRSATEWSGTSADILAGNIVRQQEAVRDARLELVLLALIAGALLALGFWWTQRSLQYDTLVARERAAGAATPAAPGVPAR